MSQTVREIAARVLKYQEQIGDIEALAAHVLASTEPLGDKRTQIAKTKEDHLQKTLDTAIASIGICAESRDVLKHEMRDLREQLQAAGQETAALAIEYNRARDERDEADGLLQAAQNEREYYKKLADDLGELADERGREVERLRPLAIQAALSLVSYEVSYGGGGGTDEAIDIAVACGYPGDEPRGEEEIQIWLRDALLATPAATPPAQPLGHLLREISDAALASGTPALSADEIHARLNDPPVHVYTSTACQHGLHDRCRKACKFCGVGCACSCHTTGPTPPAQEHPDSKEWWRTIAKQMSARIFFAERALNSIALNHAEPARSGVMQAICALNGEFEKSGDNAARTAPEAPNPIPE